MVVRLLSAILVLDQPRMLGTFQFHDDSDDEPVVRQVNVVQTDTPPGYTFTDTTGTELTTLKDPVRWEAARLVKVLTLPTDEVARRASLARDAGRAGLLDGVNEDDRLLQRMFWRYVRGELTRSELDTVATIITQRAPGQEVVWEPAADDTFPTQWWAAAQHRFRQSLLDSTVSMLDAAGLLDCTIPDIDELLDTEQLVSIVVDTADGTGERRIPSWQFRPDSDGRSELLPGLAVVLAATPRSLRDGRDLTAVMTTPNRELIVDDEPVTPAAWLAADRPLAAIVRLLTWQPR